MLFNSCIFLGFLFLSVIVHWSLPSRYRTVFLVLCGQIFYGSWDWRFLFLLWVSTLVDFVLSRRIASTSDETARKRLLIASVTTNLGLLGVFKYYNFFSSELYALLTSIGLSPSLPTLKIILPVGISFYTFQTMSYTIDVYRRELEAPRSLWTYALYVCFFPQLVAGPIERGGQLVSQIEGKRHLDARSIEEAMVHLLLGFFKKVVVADNLALFVNYVYDQPSLPGGLYLLGTYAFAFQIYCDFSGYSSIAQGCAKLLGFELSYNFRMPYLASNPSSFWRRWHMTLSSWLRDYLYIPLGGNQFGAFRTFRNLMLTMVLGGLWHGANWTFVVWGAFHGVLLCAYRTVEPVPVAAPSVGWRRILATVFFFNLVCLGWLFFRAETLSRAFDMLTGVFFRQDWSPLLLPSACLLAVFIGPLFVYELWTERRGNLLALLDLPDVLRGIVYAVLFLAVVFGAPEQGHEFLYFQF